MILLRIFTVFFCPLPQNLIVDFPTHLILEFVLGEVNLNIYIRTVSLFPDAVSFCGYCKSSNPRKIPHGGLDSACGRIDSYATRTARFVLRAKGGGDRQAGKGKGKVRYKYKVSAGWTEPWLVSYHDPKEKRGEKHKLLKRLTSPRQTNK